jgi:16S rRNA pseudouridine516 synthase
MRIDKFISECGIASRKETALAAKRGMLTVDGVAVKDVSKHIDPDRAKVVFMGKPVVYRKFTYVMLNKPEGYISATEDGNYPVVTELLTDELRRQELFPVGRLDKDTVGLMILTNNGKLAHTLLSPRHHVEKSYVFHSADPLPEGAEDEFAEGVTLADGYECKSAKLFLSSDRTSGEIVLTEGKYHQIKRMIAALGSKVTYLERVSFATLSLDRSLARGEWRLLSDSEIEELEGAAE